jgi:hypothetical protein
MMMVIISGDDGDALLSSEITIDINKSIEKNAPLTSAAEALRI